MAGISAKTAIRVDVSSNRKILNRSARLQRRLPAFRPILGTTSQIIRSSKWYKDVAGLGVDAIEINRRYSKLHFNAYFLEKVKRYLKGIHVSLHSATTGLFQELDSFSKAELAILHAEIDVAGLLDAHEVVFHINRRALNEVHKRQLMRIIDYAKEKDIDLIYESDAGLQADHTCDVLETFENIGYALDLGHLNNGYSKNLLGCEIDEFISRVRERVVYIHANNNCGTMDEHKGLNDGTLDWCAVLDLLDIHKIKKIIIEVRSIEYLKDTLGTLRHYLADIACKVA